MTEKQTKAEKREAAEDRAEERAEEKRERAAEDREASKETVAETFQAALKKRLTPQAGSDPTPAPAAPTEIVLAQATAGPDSISIVQCGHRYERTVALDGVTYEFTGHDTEGRRIYRNQTKAG